MNNDDYLFVAVLALIVVYSIFRLKRKIKEYNDDLSSRDD